MATAVATKPATKTVHIDYTTATTIRCVARVDMPEYGIKQGDVFYLARSSKNDGTYYVQTWDYANIAWQCSCPAGSPPVDEHGLPMYAPKRCWHKRAVIAACNAHHKQMREQAATEAANQKRAQAAARKAREKLAALEAQVEQQLRDAVAPLVQQTTPPVVTDIEKRLAVAGFMR